VVYGGAGEPGKSKIKRGPLLRNQAKKKNRRQKSYERKEKANLSVNVKRRKSTVRGDKSSPESYKASIRNNREAVSRQTVAKKVKT